jgi:hypothetical protein
MNQNHKKLVCDFPWRAFQTGILVMGLAAGIAVADEPSIPSSQASKLLMDLQTSGPTSKLPGVSQTAVQLHLINLDTIAGGAARLRLFVHGEGEQVLQTGDIQLEVRENGVWQNISVEAIDGGVMCAIGADGQGHREHHQSGGFQIAADLNKAWRLRVSLRVPGKYTLVAAVSPDNGATHLAQPASLGLEGL